MFLIRPWSCRFWSVGSENKNHLHTLIQVGHPFLLTPLRDWLWLIREIVRCPQGLNRMTGRPLSFPSVCDTWTADRSWRTEPRSPTSAAAALRPILKKNFVLLGNAYFYSIFSIFIKPIGTATSRLPLALWAMTPRRGSAASNYLFKIYPNYIVYIYLISCSFQN